MSTWLSREKQTVKITDILDGNLYIGNWLSTKPEILKQYNIGFVISIGVNPVDTHINKIQFMYVDIDDNPDSALKLNSVLKQLLLYLHQKRSNDNIKCLIHCTHGVSASIALGVAYLMKFKKMSLHEAKVYILKLIPLACPNEGFCEVLEYFDDLLLKQ
jgi:predicted protein tyrosine phosphatase